MLDYSYIQKNKEVLMTSGIAGLLNVLWSVMTIY